MGTNIQNVITNGIHLLMIVPHLLGLFNAKHLHGFTFDHSNRENNPRVIAAPSL